MKTVSTALMTSPYCWKPCAGFSCPSSIEDLMLRMLSSSLLVALWRRGLTSLLASKAVIATSLACRTPASLLGQRHRAALPDEGRRALLLEREQQHLGVL